MCFVEGERSPCSKLCSHGGVSSNQRYGSDVSAAVIREFLTWPRAISLTAEELGADEVVDVVDGDEVDAWVRFPETPVCERERVVAYMDRAVRVQITRRDGSTYRVWVWQGAVSKPERRW